jgi:fatty-acyl-CoA synthase
LGGADFCGCWSANSQPDLIDVERHIDRESTMTQSSPDKTVTNAPLQPSYVSGISTLPLLGDTIGANLDRTTARVGNHEALVECATGRRFSYPQLVEEVNACALGLDTLGVAKGDRVGIWAPNCAEWVFAQYGTAKLGAILVNINPAYRTHELSYVLKQAGISVLLSAPEFMSSD